MLCGFSFRKNRQSVSCRLVLFLLYLVVCLRQRAIFTFVTLNFRKSTKGLWINHFMALKMLRSWRNIAPVLKAFLNKGSQL